MSQRILSFKHRVDGVLTDATSAVLSDPTGTFGLVRTDSGEILVADGTAFTRVATGTYQYTLTDPAAGLTYQYWIEVVYGGVTKRIERYSDPPAPTPPSDPAPRRMSTAEYLALIDSAISATLSGQAASFSGEGKSLVSFSLRELQDLRERVAAQLVREQAGNAGGDGFTVARFR